MPLLLLYVLFIESSSFVSSTNRLLHLCVCEWMRCCCVFFCYFFSLSARPCSFCTKFLLFLSKFLRLSRSVLSFLHCSRNLFYFILFFSLRFSFIASRFAYTFSVSIKVFKMWWKCRDKAAKLKWMGQYESYWGFDNKKKNAKENVLLQQQQQQQQHKQWWRGG